MPHDVHNTAQTAFRFPEAVLARLKAGAKRHGETMTDIVVRGTVAELDRLDGITISSAPASPVSPSRRARKPRADAVPPATFVPAEPRRTRHALTCKCGICRPVKTGGKP